MKQPLAILYFDPDAGRSKRTGAAIKHSRPDSYITIVHTVDEFRSALVHARFDAILAGADNRDVTTLAHRVCPDAPVLVLAERKGLTEASTPQLEMPLQAIPVTDSTEIVLALEHLVTTSRQRRRKQAIQKEYRQRYSR